MQRARKEYTTTSGWSISTVVGPIISDIDSEEYRAALGGVLTLPEMLFCYSQVQIAHPATGLVFHFNAFDALHAWKEENLPPLQVNVASEWRKSREAEIEQQRAVQLHYDWTYTSPYTGSVTHAVPAPACSGGCSSSSSSSIRSSSTGSQSTNSSIETPAGSVSPSTLHHQQQQQAAARVTQPLPLLKLAFPAAGAHGSLEAVAGDSCSCRVAESAQWESTTEQIDRSVLMEREPILFFDEVLLYESDLDDNGVVQMSVKFRVMGKAWYVLLRLWLRVDGVMVRLREVRLFCRHDQSEANGSITVLREVKHCERSFKALCSCGAPGDGPAYADADSAGQVFASVAPIGQKLFELHKLTVPLRPQNAV
ncbi:MAG: hypothetical protein WDW38_007629 [Sanguina aurantia]